jgi:hypothetical protein
VSRNEKGNALVNAVERTTDGFSESYKEALRGYAREYGIQWSLVGVISRIYAKAIYRQRVRQARHHLDSMSSAHSRARGPGRSASELEKFRHDR